MNAWRHILLILTCRCEQAELIRLKAGYGEASRVERVAEAMHRLVCVPCRQSADHMDKIGQVVRRYRDERDPAADSRGDLEP